MNYKPFNELADIALKYMNPANDWRFIHADTYMFYNISNQSTYNNSIPAWKYYQQVLFKEIRLQINKPEALISNLMLVKCTPYTVVHPLPTDSGLITLKSNKMYAAIRNEKSRKNSYRQMYLHSPNLFKWGDTESFGFYVNEQEKPIYPGGRILQLYPKDGSLFWYYKIDAAYTRRAEPIV